MADIVNAGPVAEMGISRAAQEHVEAFQAFKILQAGFVVAPVVAGADKFFNSLVDWERYLSPIVTQLVSGRIFMMAVGVIEILAGILVALKPRIGGYVVSAWLLGIVVNLVMIPGFYDIALRDFGLALGGLALAKLAEHHAR